jgi:hypothetical protein
MVKRKIIRYVAKGAKKRIGSGALPSFKEWKELERLQKQRAADLALVKKFNLLPKEAKAFTGAVKKQVLVRTKARKKLLKGGEKTKRLFKQHAQFGRLGSSTAKLGDQLEEVHRAAKAGAEKVPHFKMSQKYKPKTKSKKTKWTYAGLAAAVGGTRGRKKKQ